MKKKILLFVAMLFCAVSVFAQDTYTDEEQGFTYKLFKDETAATAEVSKFTGSSTEITISATISYKGTVYNVTSIGEKAFYVCSGLTSVTIPNSVTSIGEDAFKGCSDITDIYCYADPDNLTWNESN